MEKAKQALQLLSTVLNAAPIPDPFKSAVTAIPDIALQIIEIVDAVKGNVDDAKALAVYIATVTDKTMRPFAAKPDELERSPDTQMRLQEFQGALEKIKEEIKTLLFQRLGGRILSYDTDASKLAGMKQSVDDAMNQLQLETVVAVGHDVNIIRQDQSRMFEEQRQMNQEQRIAFQTIEENNRLTAQQQLLIVRQPDMSREERLDEATNLLISQLGNVDSGAAKKPPCVAGTREHVLGRIEEWIEDTSSGSKHCYLLLGPAGTGKSAIASSIANRWIASRRLGAVFHFTRDEQARNKGSILALAQQLARWADRRLRSKIAAAIELARKDGLDIAQMTLEYQFLQLIEEPLRSLDGVSPALVIILDALDECDEAYAMTLLRLFGGLFDGLFDRLSKNVKLFITSRGELQLQHCYNSEPLKSQLETHFLGDEKAEHVEGDISLYFKQQLPVLVGHLVTNPSTWPGDEKRRALVSKTQGLFICATTVARMLADPNILDPETQLEGILSSNDAIRLDDIYGQILDRACPTSSHNNLLALFRNVLGALVVARVPINIHTLASLLSPDGVEDPREGSDEQRSEHERFANRIRVSVLSLQAVLIVPDVEAPQARDAKPIRFIHSSFTDYLTDESRCKPRFLLDLSEQHEQLAIGCLRRMRNLKRNMCDLDPSLLNSEVEDLEKRIRENISPGLQYACAHMPEHVSQTPTGSAEVGSLVREFARVRLMNWLEGLSLMERVHEAVGMSLLIESWLKAGLYPLASSPSPNIAPLVHTPDNPRSRSTSPIPGFPTIPESSDLRKRTKNSIHTGPRVIRSCLILCAFASCNHVSQTGGVDDGNLP
ncbi:hypothetical protein FRB94_014752 [Tulasnella sp. JGI-2019a]|nr:hypothetical protein FRB94_014752 [Tulasnella sp. JGI-2019a]